MSASVFEGSFANAIPGNVGETSPTMNVEIRCAQTSGCVLTMGDSTERYDKVGPLPDSVLAQARFALKYARERRERAALEIPTLQPLLDSTADIAGCIDLGYTDPPGGLNRPGYSILCKIDPNPWNKPAVLFMGSILAGCGPAFCRYGLIPLFVREARKQ